MGRIESDKINFGNSFVVSSESNRLTDSEIKQARQIAETLINEAKQKALVIEAKAASNAEKIIADATLDANSKVEEITEAARKKGYDAGYNDGFEKISTEMEEKILNMDKFAKSDFEMKKRIIKSMHTDILELVIAICRKVCQGELEQNPKLLENLVLGAISQLKEKENITIIVNPKMAEKIYNISDKIKSTVQSLESVRIMEDSSVSADGTIVESVGSRVDSRLCAQINIIAQELYKELNSTSEDEMVKESENESDQI